MPGDGWDGKYKNVARAETKDLKTLHTFTQGTGREEPHWGGEIARGMFTGQSRHNEPFSLTHIVRKSPTLNARPPQGAVVLFDGTEATAKEWNGGRLVEGNLLNNGITSKKKFKDFKLHLEFRLPFMPYAGGQGRANSGVYLQNRYEVQILDSFGLKGRDSECGGIYAQAAPRVNPTGKE